MITYSSKLVRIDKTTGKSICKMSFNGLQADTKPVTEYEGALIANGSTFMEIDGDGFFMYDEENAEWKSKA